MRAGEPRQALGQAFDRVAEAYDAVRPSYPASLVDLAVDHGKLRPGSRVLEIGCGTGKLTELLVERGLHVDAVDPGPNMIEVARRRFSAADVTFHLGRFEDLDVPGRPFDAVFSATAFHWVDPSIGWLKAARNLKPGGVLALLSHVNVRDEQSRGLQDAFAALLGKHAPDVAAEWRPPMEFDTVLAGVEERRGNASEVWDWLMRGGLQRPSMAVPEAASLFEDVEVASEPYVVEQTADELHAQFRTTAIYHRLAPAQREAFEADEKRAIERDGGRVRFSLAVLLMTARRTGSGAF
ncbi:MAG TPA: class I SAM-dependent methyltransferase [Gaiellaceae bacterium]|nr:class I SAM-dependent methyltransferase [Gaiellaceae bacterium]